MVFNVGNSVLRNGNGMYSSMAIQQQQAPSSSCAEYEFNDPHPQKYAQSKSQQYAQPHVTHTSESIETARNPAYGCTQPHVTE